MLTRILHNSDKLRKFMDDLELSLYVPQRRHILNMADALLVCEDEKTLAALQRQFVQAPDASNMADCLRISPWSADMVRNALRHQQVQWLLAEAQTRGYAPIIYVNIDDSLGAKDKGTRSLEPVDWFCDHSESQPKRSRYKKAFCYLECTVCIGDLSVTVDLRLYLRERTVRRLNRQRPKAQRLAFRSKISLARSMLAALQPLLPRDGTVYVQFDSWYAAARLIKYARRQGWHVNCGLKCNRTLNKQRLDQLATTLRQRRYTRATVTATDGTRHTYYVRHTTGRLTKVPYDVRVFFSKRHPREQSPAYFMSTDLTRTTTQVLQGYRGRWSCEVVNFYLKTQLGLADFRVRSYAAVDKYMVVVLLAWAYVERRFAQEHSAQLQTYGDIIRLHRDEHAVDWLSGALDMLLATQDKQLVLQRFLRLTPTPA